MTHTHWVKHARDTLAPAVLALAIVFCWNLLIVVPARIRRDADSAATLIAHIAAPSAPPWHQLPSGVPSREPPIPIPARRFMFAGYPSWPDNTRVQVSADLNRFCTYLSDLGFDVPLKLPRLELVTGGIMEQGVGLQLVYLYPPFWPSDVDYIDSIAIMISDKSSADIGVTREGLAQYLFSMYIGTNDVTRTEWERRREVTPIIATYFNWSYANQDTGLYNSSPPYSLKTWTAALWDMRNVLGKQYVDQLLYYTVKRLGQFEWRGNEPLQMSFDTWLFNFGISEGISKAGFSRIGDVAEILHRHGIMVWAYHPKIGVFMPHVKVNTLTD